MIKSMTGFGRGEVRTENLKAVVELKSVNHRYCEIVLRMPRSMNVLEDRIRRVIQEKVTRGRIDAFVNIELCGKNKQVVKFEEDLAGNYISVARDIKAKLQLTGEVSVTDLLHLPGVISLEEPESDVEQWWPVVEEAFTAALDALLEMRIREGDRLNRDIMHRARLIAGMVGEIEKRAPVMVDDYRQRLHQRIKELLEPGLVDQARLDAEVVLFAERSAITEEIVRLNSHLAELSACLEGSGAVGRKLDFLMQEMNREINTIASKSADLTINRTVVEIKSELEKIREQVQNIE